MTEERIGMDDPAMRLTHWLAGTERKHYSPRNDMRAVLSELVRLRVLLSEHHAVGVLDGAKVGDRCPICKERT